MKEYDDDRLEDKLLVARILRGDKAMFRLVIDRTQGLVTQIIFKMIANPEDRRDIAQDVYLKVFDKLGSFNFQSKLSTWVWQITFNTCVNYLEKKKLVVVSNTDTDEENDRFLTFPQADVFTNHIEKQLINKDLSEILQRETDKLSPLYKILITLYHHEEMSYSEIAGVVQLPEGTVKSYLFRARKMLKDRLLTAYKKESL